MEMLLLVTWLSIINGALGGQYILNWMGNQPKFTGGKPVDVTPGVMTWWRELSKLVWALGAVTIELIRGKKAKYLWPGGLSLATIIICAFTGVIENIGFFYLPRYYSPHIYAPYVNVYLALLPFFGKFMFKSEIRKEHWIGIILVVIGLSIPHVLATSVHSSSVLDANGIIWILIINLCLMSQQVLNNKTVQTALPNVGPNALVLWREIWKMIFISSALFIFPIIGNAWNVHLPEKVAVVELEQRFADPKVKDKIHQEDKEFLFTNYEKTGSDYVLKQDLPEETKERVKKIFAAIDYNRFFSLFEGTIIPNNWWPIFFVVLAGLSGYIYSFGFFKLARFSAHFWVPYTNVYLAIIPLIMFLFGKEVTIYQILGAVVTTAGLMVGVSDYKRHKVTEIERKYKE